MDWDSSVSPTHGDQEGSAYNRHFECMCYHPLFRFNQYGDLQRTMLRRSNHSSAKSWRRVLLPGIDRYRDRDVPKYFRGDAAFAIPVLHRVLEEQSFQYTIRIPANKVLMGSISHLLTRPAGRPSHNKPKVFYECSPYQAQISDRPRRALASKLMVGLERVFVRKGARLATSDWFSKFMSARTWL